MRANITRISLMEKVHTTGAQANGIKEDGSSGSSMVQGFMCGLMRTSIKANGKMVKGTGR